MKKILTFAATLVAVSTLSNTAHASSSGCGLGNILLNGNRGVASNVLAVTTNGSSGNQTFGITSGTLGCDGDDLVHSDIKLAFFVDENLDQLAKDIANGSGEYLEASANLLGVKEGDKVHFFSVMQNNFSNIFSSENAQTVDVIAAISKVLESDETLKSYKI